jgi:transposase
MLSRAHSPRYFPVRQQGPADHQVHAVLAKCGIQVPMSDLFGLAGTALLDDLTRQGRLPAPYAARIASLRRVMDLLDFEIDIFTGLARGRLARDPGFTAVQTIPGIGPVLGAVFVAEIGDVTRFATAQKLTCWAGMTPKHRESDTHVRRGSITKQGSRLVRWAAVESVKVLPRTSLIGAFRDQVAARRGKNIAAVAAARRQLEYVYYALRDHHVRALTSARTPAPQVTPQVA